MKIIYIIIIIGLLLISGVHADGEELWFSPNTTMDIKAYCYDSNKTICADGTECMITIFYPNSSIFVNNETMSQLAGNKYYNYTANATEILGVYSAIIDCISGNIGNGYETFKFYVGRPSTYVQTGITQTALWILFGVAILMFIGFLLIKHVPLKWTFFMLSILFIVIAINTISISMRNEAGPENLRNIFDKIGSGTYIMYWVCAGIILFIWIFSIFNSINSKRNMEMARRVGAPISFK